MYTYGILLTDDNEKARQHNRKLLGPTTLGIEITRSDLAEKCGLGNIDPQHGLSPQPNQSAISDSLTYSLPPEGTTLVTIRPDADAFGAMAVLTARSEGKQNLIRHELIEMVHLIDCFGLDTALQKNPKIQEYRRENDALQQIVRNRSSRWPSIKERVLAVMQILTDMMAIHKIEEVALMREIADYTEFRLTIVVPDTVMFIETRGQYSAARSYGQQRFPITIICDYEYVMPGVEGYMPHKRLCIAKQNGTNVIDMNRLKRYLNQTEAHLRNLSLCELEKLNLLWGGPINLAVFPQSKVSEIGKNEMFYIVKQCIL